jgi:hypothetical protein
VVCARAGISAQRAAAPIVLEQGSAPRSHGSLGAVLRRAAHPLGERRELPVVLGLPLRHLSLLRALPLALLLPALLLALLLLALLLLTLLLLALLLLPPLPPPLLLLFLLLLPLLLLLLVLLALLLLLLLLLLLAPPMRLALLLVLRLRRGQRRLRFVISTRQPRWLGAWRLHGFCKAGIGESSFARTPALQPSRARRGETAEEKV